MRKLRVDIMRATCGLLIALTLASCDESPQETTNAAMADTSNSGGDLLGGLAPDDRKALAGNGAIGGPVGKLTLPASPEEKAYLNGSADDAQFLEYVFRTYPDLKAVPFKPDDEIRSDPDTYAQYRQGFYMGLYFARRIRLANSETLFDFLRTCSKSLDPLTSATMDVMAKPKPGFSMQFFPVLQLRGSGETTELQILLDRQGDVITARSPLFSTSVLQSKTFMEDHGVACGR